MLSLDSSDNRVFISTKNEGIVEIPKFSTDLIAPLAN